MGRLVTDLDPGGPQQLGGLGVGEGEVGRPELEHRVGEPVAVERQDRVGSADEDETEPPHAVPEQEVHLTRKVQRCQLVAVDDRRSTARTPPRPTRRVRSGAGSRGRRRRRRSSWSAHPAPTSGATPSMCSQKAVSPSSKLIHPVEEDPSCAHPLRHGRGLASARRRTDQDEGQLTGARQGSGQVRSRHVQRWSQWHGEPGGGQDRLTRVCSDGFCSSRNCPHARALLAPPAVDPGGLHQETHGYANSVLDGGP